ncbi:chorismate mutase [Melampsora americana]|nr:chorismate mutase [Melampsora americana]
MQVDAQSYSKDDPTNLDNIRQTLMRLEDTIIFLLIERAQFAHNQIIYENSNKFIELHADHETSFLGWILRQTEIIHAKVRRYEAPDEYPFTSIKELPQSILPKLDQSNFLYPNTINVNDQIKGFYIDQIVKPLTNKEGRSSDDGHYGSSAVRDVEVLQAVSRRIHYGKFVAERKFRDHPSTFVPHILSSNSAELEKLITVKHVEDALIRRLEVKARMYGQEVDSAGNPIDHRETNKVNVGVVVEMYREWVIPLTRHVEVEYLLRRLDGLSSEEIDDLSK